MTGWARKLVLRPVVGRLFAGAALAGLLTSLAIAQQSSGDGYAGATVSVRFADATDAVGAAGLAFSDIVTQSVTATASASVIFQNAVEEYNASRSYFVAFGEDDDSDLVPDSRDQCPDTPFEADVDANGCARIQVDQDLDGVCNSGASSPRWCTGTDICPNTPPGTVVDGSGCPLQAPDDSDGDGVLNPADNCRSVPNVAQTDSDGDRIGDFCDADDDNDGLLDGLDNCPTVEGEFPFDLDGDGLALGCDPNDGNPDTDGDALLDSWEVRGYDHDFDGPLGLTHPDGIIDVNLPAMGANPQAKDIFVEIDFMDCSVPGGDCEYDHTDRIDQNGSILPVILAFGAKGIRLHVDNGPASEVAPGIPWGRFLSQSDAIRHQEVLGQMESPSEYSWSVFDIAKSITPERLPIFHYLISAHRHPRTPLDNPPPGATTAGEARGRFELTASGLKKIGSEFLITVGTLRVPSPSCSPAPKPEGSTRPECLSPLNIGGVLMHELGHNLGLRHGGDVEANFKPNYLSVMNYSFTVGLPDRQNGTFRLDYSSGLQDRLEQANLNENQGLRPGLPMLSTRYSCPDGKKVYAPAGNEINWDCDQTSDARPNLEESVSTRIACDEQGHNCSLGTFCNLLDPFNKSCLFDFDDWSSLIFAGGNIGSAAAVLLPSVTVVEELAVEPLMMALAQDSDSDGTRDVFDICPSTPNPEQTDSDADGYGDVCEPNHSPKANAGPDRTVEATSPAGGDVNLDGTASVDLDGDSLTLTWSGPFGEIVAQAPTINLPIGEHEITLTADDGRGGIGTDTVSVTVRDSSPPTIGIIVPTNTAYSFGQAVAANYTCTDGGSHVATCAGPLPTGANIDTASLGPKTFTVNASDNVGNTSSLSVNYTVVGAPTTATVNVTPSTQQYSDTITLTATLSPATLAGQAPATNVTFIIGSQAVGTAPLVPSGGSLQASLSNVRLREPLPFGTSPTGQMLPGTHTVTAVFGGVSSNFIVTNPTTTLTITKEDARATYTGALFSSTACVTCATATVTLSATVQDISAVPGVPATDATEGDIRNATVTFQIVETGQTMAGVPIGLVNTGDTKTGTATTNVTVNLGTADAMALTVRVMVNGYYTSPVEQTVVTVAKPLSSSFIAGGGYLTMMRSAGLYPGQAGSKNNFGFSVKYNKSGTNLQGNINTLVRNNGRVYQIKGNAITSLSTNPAIGTATFNGKANIQDVTDPLNPLSIDGNATLQVTVTDKGEPGSADTIGITLWNKSGGLWFSSNWTGTQTLEQLLTGGNLVIR